MTYSSTDFPFAIVGFDLDGTLFDTHADLAEAVNHVLRAEGRPILAHSAVRDMVGGGARLLLERALLATGGPLPEERFDRCHEALLRFYEANIAVHTVLFPGAAQMLDALAERGVRLALVTNKIERLAVTLLRELDLLDRFDTVIEGDTLGPGRAKPRPDMLQAMLERCGGGRAAYVGDSTFDTRAARAAAIPCVAVSFGFNDCPPDQLGADALIDHFDQLIPTLHKL